MSDDLLHDPSLIQDFLVESEEFLQRMDQDMVALEAMPNDAELLNRIFRALHTIKGTSGFLGFEPVVRLSHRAEDVLNATVIKPLGVFLHGCSSVAGATISGDGQVRLVLDPAGLLTHLPPAGTMVQRATA